MLTRFTLLLVLLISFAANGTDAPHDRAFWRSIVQNRFAIPESSQVDALTHELIEMLASPDPELRDELGYRILGVWIEQKLSPAQLQDVMTACQANLRRGIGESGTDSVFRRSFSALCLASIAERDLDAEAYRTLLTDALTYLKDERDVRGYDAAKGWIHSTAHTADLLKALASNPRFTKDDQRIVLTAIAGRLSAVREVYTQGEQNRLAKVIVAIMTRSDFEQPHFDAWLAGLVGADRAVIANRPFKTEELATLQNRTYMLEAIVARLAMEKLSPEAAAARDEVLGVLKRR